MKRENNDNTSRNTQIEEFLSARYEFRYNTVLNRAEYRLRGTDDYTAIDRYRINTLKERWIRKSMYRSRPRTCTASSKVISPHTSTLCRLISTVYR